MDRRGSKTAKAALVRHSRKAAKATRIAPAMSPFAAEVYRPADLVPNSGFDEGLAPIVGAIAGALFVGAIVR